MTDLTTAPNAGALQSADQLMLLRNGNPFVITAAELLSYLQSTVVLQPETLAGRVAANAGGPQQIALGAGVGIGGGALVATAADHLSLAVLPQVDLQAELIVNSAGEPARLPLADLLFLLGLGATSGPNLNAYLNLVASSGVALLI